MEVYFVLGVGFLEPVYQEALAVEFSRRGIPYTREKQLNIFYKDVQLNKTYCADFVCYDQIIVELKSQFALSNIEEAQIINYMKITRMHVGLLMNFGSRPTLEWKRYVV